MKSRASKLELVKNLSVVLPEGEAVVCSVVLSEKIGRVRDVICSGSGLDPKTHALTYRMTFLEPEKTFQEFAIPDGAELRLLVDFRPRDGEGTNVILRLEGTLCSGYFSPDVTLWTVVSHLVASETLGSLEDVVPTLLHGEDEISGVDSLKKLTIRDIRDGRTRRTIFRFKLVSDRKERSRGERYSVDGYSYASEKMSLKTSGLGSTSSISTVEDRRVTFKAEEEIIEPLSEDSLMSDTRRS